MKLIIDIPEEEYISIRKQVLENITNPLKVCIANGIPYEQRPQGKWIGDTDYESYQGCYEAYKCNKCGYGLHWQDYCNSDVAKNFCPNCGADMRGVIRMRLIDADELKKVFGYTDEWYKGRTVCEYIDNAPTVVNKNLTTERPQGEWYHSCEKGWECSQCHEVVKEMPTVMRKANCNFCPNCGADMRGEEE